MATLSEKPRDAFVATLSRRQFVKAGGALVVGFKLIGRVFSRAIRHDPRSTRTR